MEGGGLKLPPGFRFKPTDYELIFHLHNKIENGPILIEGIKEVDLYKDDPKTLSEMYSPVGEKEWYFFTSRNRKHPNGSRPDRTVGCGYWKATVADKVIYNCDGKIVRFKKTLVFCQGKKVKTNWIMHEFRLDQFPQSRRNASNDMKLEDWVLCRIHEKSSSKLRGGNDEQEDAAINISNIPQVEAGVINDPIIQTVDDKNEEDDILLLFDDIPQSLKDLFNFPFPPLLPPNDDVFVEGSSWPIMDNQGISSFEQLGAIEDETNFQDYIFGEGSNWLIMENQGISSFEQLGAIHDQTNFQDYNEFVISPTKRGCVHP